MLYYLSLDNFINFKNGDLSYLYNFIKAIEASLTEGYKDISNSTTISLKYYMAKYVVNLLINKIVVMISSANNFYDDNNNISFNKENALGKVSLNGTKDSYLEGSKALPFYEADSIIINELDEALEEGKKEKKEEIADNNKPIDKNEELSKKYKGNLPIEVLFTLMEIVLNLDEQLLGMIQHEKANDDLLSLYPFKVNRMFTAFSRLGSLANFPNTNNNVFPLAEAGVFNRSDLLFDLVHYLEPQCELEKMEFYRQNSAHCLFKQLPRNRLLNGYSCSNVPLFQTVNSIPFSQQINQLKIEKVNIKL